MIFQSEFEVSDVANSACIRYSAGRWIGGKGVSINEKKEYGFSLYLNASSNRMYCLPADVREDDDPQNRAAYI